MALELVKGKPPSRCCNAPVKAALTDGILVGMCATCQRDVIRMNPRTLQLEWLNGTAVTSTEDADTTGTSNLTEYVH